MLFGDRIEISLAKPQVNGVEGGDIYVIVREMYICYRVFVFM